MDYNEFLQSKKISITPSGFEVKEVNPLLFPFQVDIVRWALKKGKAALFMGTGTGKTFCQLEWAKHVCSYTHGNVLILAPLAVANQTVGEGVKLGVPVTLCRNQSDVKLGINISNYEMMHHFDANQFVGVVLDESSIIKGFDSKTTSEVLIKFKHCGFKLACTATPSPNDFMELGNHAEFLGVMSRTEMLATFFVHDMAHTSEWRIKKHAVKDFWVWVASWAIMMMHPKDLGYVQNNFDLPELRLHEIVVDKSGYVVKEAQTLNERRGARRNSIQDRISYAAKIANESHDQFLIWCDLNVEADILKKEINDSVEVRGSDTNDFKVKSITDFTNGVTRCLISKSSMFGFGLNLQNCHNMIFFGISDSFESYFQAVRRCWRFGQEKPVDVYIITSEKEGSVVKNIKRKEKDFESMLKGMISVTSELTKANIKKTVNITESYNPQTEMILPAWINTPITIYSTTTYKYNGELMIKKTESIECICDVCGYNWTPHNGVPPKVCPKCKTHKWNVKT